MKATVGFIALACFLVGLCPKESGKVLPLFIVSICVFWLSFTESAKIKAAARIVDFSERLR